MLSTDAFEIKRLAQIHETFRILVQLAHPSCVNRQTLWSEIGYQKKRRMQKKRSVACGAQAADRFQNTCGLPRLELIQENPRRNPIRIRINEDGRSRTD
jgi:hypothetical protein